MSKVHAVLLVPEEGDPKWLLREVPGDENREDWPRSIPPQAYDAGHGAWVPYDPRTRPPYGSMHTFALVLAWDGKPVVEGLFRFSQYNGDYDEIFFITGDLLNGNVEALADNYGLGTIILLDSKGQEITNE